MCEVRAPMLPGSKRHGTATPDAGQSRWTNRAHCEVRSPYRHAIKFGQRIRQVSGRLRPQYLE